MAHVAEWKKEEVKELKGIIDQFDVIGIVDLMNIPAKQLQEMRKSLKDKAVIRMSKKNLIDLAFEEGEERVLRGYKIQFESRDGRYDCVDMDITKTDKESGIRPVNINTIKWLIFNGAKYIVE